MNTTDKIINEMAIQLANEAIERANYKIFHEEAQEKLVKAQAQLKKAQAQLARINSVLEADQALKELFDEVAENLEKED
ncbi:hypothetical protein [uncultured Streptococcus sp.]|uniref:hypothetical protein n=1 Tax=uncultured Streptococcus sp. TaxID=83427 RepID=UPI00206B9D36|nr:hypothetical protein [uncultured Streptococcus sp.]DAS42930.1 MAG TPA: hypothetical protein [Caudoviricetes sp.]